MNGYPKHFTFPNMVITEDIDGFGCLYLHRSDPDVTKYVNGVPLHWELHMDIKMYNESSLSFSKNIFSSTAIDIIRYKANDNDYEYMKHINCYLLKLAYGILHTAPVVTQKEADFYTKALQIKNSIKDELLTKCGLSVSVNQIRVGIIDVTQ